MKFLIAFLAILSLSPGIAQNKDKSKVQEKSCRLIYLQRPPDAPSEAYLFDGTMSHKVQLPGMNFSNVIKLPGGDLTLGITAGEVAPPESFPAGSPSVLVPANVTDFYLLVATDPANKVFPVRLVPLDVSAEKLRPGQTIWVNLTTHRIAARLGSETLEIAPSSRVVGKAPLAESGFYKAQFAYLPQGQNEFLPIMNKSWWHDASSKNLGFVIDSGGRLPRIFTFRDFRSPEPTDEEKAALRSGQETGVEPVREGQ